MRLVESTRSRISDPPTPSVIESWPTRCIVTGTVWLSQAAEAALGAASASGDFNAVQARNAEYEAAKKAVDDQYARWEWLEKKGYGEEGP